MDTEKLTTIIVTAFIAAVLTFLSKNLWDWWRESKKTKYEERKLLRKALFNLTNLWQNLQAWDFEKQIDFSGQLLLEQFAQMGAKPEDLEKLKIADSDRRKMVSFQTNNANEKLKLLEEQVKNAIQELSIIQPLMASELHEMQLRTPVPDMEKLMEEQFKDGRERSEYELNMFASLQNQYFNAFKNRLSERLKPFILSVAKKIDKKELKSTTEYLEAREKEWAEMYQGNNSEELQKFAQLHTEMFIKAHLESSPKTPANTENESQINLENQNSGSDKE